MAEGDDLISVKQAVSEFNRSRKTIFEWLREGKLKRYRSEGDLNTLVSRTELRNLIKPREESR